MSETLADYLASQQRLVQEAALALPHDFTKSDEDKTQDKRCICALPVRKNGVSARLAQSRAIQTMTKLNYFRNGNFAVTVPLPPSLTRAPCARIWKQRTRLTYMAKILKANSVGAGGPTTRKRKGRPCYNVWPAKIGSMSRAAISGNGLLHEPLPSSRIRKKRLQLNQELTSMPFQRDRQASHQPSFLARNMSLSFADQPWRRLVDALFSPAGGSGELVDIENTDAVDKQTAGNKRPLSPSNLDTPEAKRPRATPSTPKPPPALCLAPRPNPMAQRVFAQRDAAEESSLGTGDLFLSEGFRDRWCYCASCLPALEASRYLLEEEETYEPPEDPDSGLSLEELGMRALERLPRDKAIDGIHAFNGMKDDLVKYLRPFAQEGKVVNESDVREFFASLTEASKKKKS
ncbi:putative PHD zinc finger [Lyophyllum shimeji]|uniref:PHD zinc finger n=1 Tax=Lyophyllum shimeji TaxID=47721 RepID=A0A9P3PS38_LYOSH|nr:putative PHD zinc finger [Lyophyllum shimeji]